MQVIETGLIILEMGSRKIESLMINKVVLLATLTHSKITEAIAALQIKQFKVKGGPLMAIRPKAEVLTRSVLLNRQRQVGSNMNSLIQIMDR